MSGSRRDGGRWNQLAFSISPANKLDKIRKGHNCFGVISSDKKKRRERFMSLFFMFSFTILHQLFCNYVEEELSLCFSLVLLKTGDGAINAGFVGVPVEACSVRQ